MAFNNRSSMSSSNQPARSGLAALAGNRRILVGAVLGFFGLMVLLGSYEIVPPGHRGIVIHAGKVQDQVLGEGLTFKIPFYTTIKAFPVRVEESTIETEAASHDMQKVHTTLSLNWHITPDKVNDVFRRLGEPKVIQANVINHSVSEVLKAATAQMSAEEILSKRVELKSTIDNALVARLKQFDITVDAVNLSDFHFDENFNKAVEDKQIAEQNAKKAIYIADQAKNDAVAAVNTAQGQADAMLKRARAEAEANTLKQKTLTDQLIRYETVQKWDGKLPSIVGGHAIPMIQMPVGSAAKGE